MQENEIIHQLQIGNEKAFEAVYTMYSKSLYGIIYNITRDEAVSEELLQDVFLKIWNNASSYDSDKGRFFTWILNIARNASIDRLRSKDFKNTRSNLKSDNFTDILESKTNTAGRLDAIGLEKYVEILEPICKKLIDLLFFKGFTQKESAEKLQIPLGTVKTRNRVCIDKLRAYIVE